MKLQTNWACDTLSRTHKTQVLFTLDEQVGAISSSFLFYSLLAHLNHLQLEEAFFEMLKLC